MAFDMQPVLTGQLLSLRPLAAGDFESLYAVAADPLIWEQHPEKTRCEEGPFRAFFAEALDSGGALAALDGKDGKIIGTSRFFGHDKAASRIEIGWTFLARSRWGGAYNGEMKRLMLRHAFGQVERVVFVIDSLNLRSQRAVEKIGGVRIATKAAEGGLENWIYQITADTFVGRNGRQN